MPVYLNVEVTAAYLTVLVEAYRRGRGSSNDSERDILDRLAASLVVSEPHAEQLGAAQSGGVTPPDPPNPEPEPVSGYFVDPSGDDGNDGSDAHPWATINHALTQVQAGDTVWLRQGEHNGELHQGHGPTRWNSGGSWDNAIHIKAYPDEAATITRQLGYDNEAEPASYHIWENITFVDAVPHGNPIYAVRGAHHIRFLNCEITNNNVGGQGSHQADDTTHHFEWIGCHVHHCGVAFNLDHGFYLGGSDNLIENCHVHDNKAAGIQIYPQGHRNTVRKCNIHDNVYGIIFWGGEGSQAVNNLIWNFNDCGIQSSYQTNLVIAHCTMYNGVGSSVAHSGSKNTTIRNNIAYQCKGGLYQQYEGDEPVQDHNLTSDPRFVDASSGDFHLQSNSGARNKGADMRNQVPDDYDGVQRDGTPDIGAYEYAE